jgi:hypothetical protein
MCQLQIKPIKFNMFIEKLISQQESVLKLKPNKVKLIGFKQWLLRKQ